MKYSQVMNLIEKGKIDNVYLLEGEENLLKEEIIDLIKEKLINVKTKDFDFDVVYASQSAPVDVINLLLMLPVSSKKRVVVLKEIESWSNLQWEKFFPYLENPNPSSCLILVAQEKINLKKGIYFTINKMVNVITLWHLDKKDIFFRIKQTLRRFNKEIDSLSCEYLFNLTDNLLDLKNEIEKLVIFTGDKKMITLEDVEAIRGETKTQNIYALTEAISLKNKERALEIIQNLKLQNIYHLKVLNFIVNWFRKLIYAKVLLKTKSLLEVKRELNISDFYHPHFQKEIDNFTLEELKKCFNYFLEADRSFKTTQLPPFFVLERLVVSITAPGSVL